VSTARLALTIALATLVLAPGCITFDGEAEIQARVLVTEDVGTQPLHDENLTLRQGASAMDALRQVAQTETSHGGGFVEAIDGKASQYPDEKVDWFYHVNTKLAGVGAAQYTLEDGDAVVFDYRHWERTMHLPHLLTGLDDWPADLTEPRFDREAFTERQNDADQRANLYAHVNGTSVTVLDPAGEPARTLEAPWLLAHAVAGPTDQPRILLVASGDAGRALVDELAQTRPTGVGAVVTPNATQEVPAG
jgi:hypothetical protein